MLTHLAAALLGAVLAAACAWQVHGWRMESELQASKTALESLRRQHAEALTRATGSALQTTIQWQKEKDDAIARAQERAKLQAAGALAARRSADRLRSTLDAASVRLPVTAHAACTEYATATSGLLDQCSAALTDLAAKADGHAGDARTLSEAWPMNPSRPDAGDTNEGQK